MRSMFAFGLIILITVILMVPSSKLEAETAARSTISKADAKCILRYIDRFLNNSDDPVQIFLDMVCHDSFRGSGTTRHKKYKGLGGLPSPRFEPNSGEHLRHIIISKAALLCLKKFAKNSNFPKSDSIVLIEDCE